MIFVDNKRCQAPRTSPRALL